MAIQIQLRRDSAANWTSVNPILAEGEEGIEIGSPDKIKIGDGITAWTGLPYFGGGGGSSSVGPVNAMQTSDGAGGFQGSSSLTYDVNSNTQEFNDANSVIQGNSTSDYRVNLDLQPNLLPVGTGKQTALQFNGTSSYVTVAGQYHLYPSGGGPFQVECWIKNSTHGDYIVLGVQDPVHEAYYFRSAGSDGKYNAYIQNYEGTLFSVSGTVDLDDGNWHHLALVHRGTSHIFELYEDGVSAGTTTTSGTITNVGSQPFLIGSGTNEKFFPGIIDEVRIMNSGEYTSDFTPEHSFPLKADNVNITAAYWNFNEGSGTILNDVTGNGNTGTIVGNPTWVTGLPTYGLQFANGTSYSPSYVDISSDIGSASDYTVEMWLQDGNSGPTDANVLSSQDFTSLNLNSAAGPNRLQFSSTGGVSLQVQTGGGSSFRHFAFQRSGTTATAWVDGVLQQTATCSADTVNFGPIYISKYTVGRGLTGTLDEIRISNAARYSSTFVPSANFAVDTSTLGYWKMEEGTGTTIFDSSGNGHDGVFVNDATPLAFVDGVNAPALYNMNIVRGYTSGSDSVVDVGMPGISKTNVYGLDVEFQNNVHIPGKLTVDGSVDPTDVTFSHITTPGNPATGKSMIYTKSDDHAYLLNHTGSEIKLDDPAWNQISGTQTDVEVGGFANTIGYIVGTDVPSFEADPVFNSWLSGPPNVSIFTNDAGYLIPTGTVAYQGDNVSEFTNDANYATLPIAISNLGDGTSHISQWTNDAGYLTSSTVLLLDQTTPQTFTAGTVTGSGFLTVASGTLGLDTNGYVANNATGIDAMAIGFSTTATGTSATVLGVDSGATGVEAIVIGVNSSGSGELALAIGQNASASGGHATAIGSYLNGYDNSTPYSLVLGGTNGSVDQEWLRLSPGTIQFPTFGGPGLMSIDVSGNVGVDTTSYLTPSTGLTLDQSSPQTFTDGAVTGSGLLSVTSGTLGLDTSAYIIGTDVPTYETDPVYSANTYAVNMNQGVASTDSPSFVEVDLSGQIVVGTDIVSVGAPNQVAISVLNRSLYDTDGTTQVASWGAGDGSFHVYGKLNVDGAIDPTYLALTPQATQPTPAVGLMYVDDGTNGTAGHLYYSIDGATYSDISTGGGSTPGLSDVLTVSNDGGNKNMTNIGYVSDSSAAKSLDFENRALMQDTSIIATWNTTTGVNLNGNVITNASFINDASSLASIDPNSRVLYYNDGASVSVNYQGSRLEDTTGNPTVDWQATLLGDSSSLNSLNWNTRIGYGADGTTPMFSYGTSFKPYDTYSLPTGTGTSGQVITSDGTGGSTWSNPYIPGLGEVLATSPDGNGLDINNVANLNAGNVYTTTILDPNGPQQVLDVVNRSLGSTTVAVVASWSGGTFTSNNGFVVYDAGNTKSMDAGVRKLYLNGTTVMADWSDPNSTGKLADGSGVDYATVNEVLFLDQTTPQTVANGAPTFSGGIHVTHLLGSSIYDGSDSQILVDGPNNQLVDITGSGVAVDWSFRHLVNGSVIADWSNPNSTGKLADGSGNDYLTTATGLPTPTGTPSVGQVPVNDGIGGVAWGDTPFADGSAGANWATTTPTTVNDAINRIATQVAILLGNPIP